MRNSKLIYFLGKMSRDDLNSFSDFVASPYFNRKKSLLPLLEYLVGSFLGKPPYPSKEEVYRAVYGDGDLKLSTLRTSISELMALLQRFLSIRNFESDRSSQNLRFLNSLVELNAPKQFPFYFEKSQRELSRSRLDSWNHLHHSLLLVEAQHEFLLRRPGRKPNESLTEGFHLLNHSYMVRFLRYQLHILSGAVSFEPYADWDFSLASDFVKNLAGIYRELPGVIRVYLLLLGAYSDAEKFEDFDSLVEFAESVAAETSENEYNDIYTLTINFAAKRINQGDLSLIPKALDYYRFLLKKKLLLNEGRLSAWHFKNIVNLAARNRQFDWARDFIECWRGKVFPDFENNAYQFNLGVIDFYEKDFESASRQFYHVLQSYEDIFYGLNARCYLLQVQYELREMKSLEAQTHSLRMFLDRQEDISDLKRRQYIDFLNHLKRLCNLPPYDEARREKLRQDILSRESKGMGSAWLIEKIDEMP